MTRDNSNILLEYTKIKENAVIANTNSITKQNQPSARKEGTLQLVSPNGEVLGSYKFVNGGGGRGFLPGGSYTVTGRENLAPSDVRPMTVGGVGYKYRVLTNAGSPQIPDPRFPNAPRSGILIHPDGGAPGTNGCIGIVGGPDVQKDFMQKMDALIQQGGGRYSFKFDSGGPAASPMAATNQPSVTPPPAAETVPAATAPAGAAAPQAATPSSTNTNSFASFMNMLNSLQPAQTSGQQPQPTETPFGRMAAAAAKPSAAAKSQFSTGRMRRPTWASK